MKWTWFVFLLNLGGTWGFFYPFIKKSLDCHREAMKKNIRNHNKAVGYFIIKSISSFLPYADTIGHKVLHADNEFINFVMNLDDSKIPHELKGKIILSSIKMAQKGDEFGSHMLQWYYDIVKRCFEMDHDS